MGSDNPSAPAGHLPLHKGGCFALLWLHGKCVEKVLFHVKQCTVEQAAGNTILRLGVAVILYWINAQKSGIIIK